MPVELGLGKPNPMSHRDLIFTEPNSRIAGICAKSWLRPFFSLLLAARIFDLVSPTGPATQSMHPSNYGSGSRAMVNWND